MGRSLKTSIKSSKIDSGLQITRLLKSEEMAIEGRTMPIFTFKNSRRRTGKAAWSYVQRSLARTALGCVDVLPEVTTIVPLNGLERIMNDRSLIIAQNRPCVQLLDVSSIPDCSVKHTISKCHNAVARRVLASFCQSLVAIYYRVLHRVRPLISHCS